MRHIFLIAILNLYLILMGIGLVASGKIETVLASSPSAQSTPSSISATPTIDRLAAPPTVYPPSQADTGAQLFWLYCQPCHGDRGQGLTDEWRAEYPEDHQNCWARGCHAKSPYPGGFTLPTMVPAVIGEGSLFRFATVGQVFNYIRSEMPLEYPGSLSDEEYLAIAAFLARAHGAGDGRRLNINNVEQVRLRAVPLSEYDSQGTRQAGSAQTNFFGTPEPNGNHQRSNDLAQVFEEPFIWMGIFLAVLLAGGGWLWQRLK